LYKLFFMKSRSLLGLIAALCCGFLLFALYLQHFKDVFPCTLCVLQRYAYIVLALFCLIGVVANAPRVSAAFGFVAAVTGLGLAAYQLWVIAHPSISCGNDPLEKAINQVFTAKLWPSVFKAEGFCSEVYEPIFGLSAPQWSLVWFVLFALALLWIMLRHR